MADTPISAPSAPAGARRPSEAAQDDVEINALARRGIPMIRCEDDHAIAAIGAW